MSKPREWNIRLTQLIINDIPNPMEPQAFVKVREVTEQQERWRKGLELIAMNYDGTQTLSGTQCADIAREALGYDPEGKPNE